MIGNIGGDSSARLCRVSSYNTPSCIVVELVRNMCQLFEPAKKDVIISHASIYRFNGGAPNS